MISSKSRFERGCSIGWRIVGTGLNQLRGPRRLWKFPPGTAWLAMTDGCCHADLRGRCLLEHSFFVAPGVLALPELAPARLIP